MDGPPAKQDWTGAAEARPTRSVKDLLRGEKLQAWSSCVGFGSKARAEGVSVRV